MRVAGSLTAVGTPTVEFAEVSSVVEGAGGQSIGSAQATHQVAIDRGDTMPFALMVPVSGQPASCLVQWGALNSTALIPTK